MKKRVLVAMSGGVDSAVAAALLVQQGMSVEGVTMKLTAGLCCDIGSAQAVCRHLGIPHRMIDAQALFEQNVVQDFISEYRIGRTPNPCIRCNDLIKFQMLLSYAREEWFDALATGHYARVEQDAASSRFLLKKGMDASKDQSYFLYRLTQEQLRSVLFPLGEMHKTDVRDLARKLDLPAAERPESQEICFVPNDDYRAFLKEHAPTLLRPGEVVMTDGKVVGNHDGIALFTVGQRRKLGVAAGERLYVVRIEPETNRVVLGRRSELQTGEMLVSDPTWTMMDKPTAPVEATVKIRYRSPFAPAVIQPLDNNTLRVIFKQPVPGVCPGQSAVFYDNELVIGGGTIDATPTMHR
jgi:tRNA-uridine 2-sulfurtransferase